MAEMIVEMLERFELLVKVVEVKGRGGLMS
jgi:hypothetical protein